VDEARKRLLGIMAAILAARKLANYDSVRRVPATESAIADAVRLAADGNWRWPETKDFVDVKHDKNRTA